MINIDFENEMSDAAKSWLAHARQYPQDLIPRNTIEYGMKQEHMSTEECEYIFKVVSPPS